MTTPISARKVSTRLPGRVGSSGLIRPTTECAEDDACHEFTQHGRLPDCLRGPAEKPGGDKNHGQHTEKVGDEVVVDEMRIHAVKS